MHTCGAQSAFTNHSNNPNNDRGKVRGMGGDTEGAGGEEEHLSYFVSSR